MVIGLGFDFTISAQGLFRILFDVFVLRLMIMVAFCLLTGISPPNVLIGLKVVRLKSPGYLVLDLRNLISSFRSLSPFRFVACCLFLYVVLLKVDNHCKQLLILKDATCDRNSQSILHRRISTIPLVTFAAKILPDGIWLCRCI